MTPTGREAFEKYVDALKEYIPMQNIIKSVNRL